MINEAVPTSEEPQRPARTVIHVHTVQAERAKLMAKADYQSATEWISRMIGNEWATRDPRTGARTTAEPIADLRKEIEILKTKVLRLEGALLSGRARPSED